MGKWLSGGTPRKGTPDFWNGKIPWVSPKDMKRSRLYDAIDRVTEKALGNGTRLAPAHSLLLVVRGMILAHSFPVGRAEVPLAFNQDIKALVPRDDVDSDFLLWWLTANESVLLGITTESTHGTKRVPMDELRVVPIDVPPLREQRAIAKALSDVDALLDGLERLIAKKRDLKQAAIQQLLTGRNRLPGFRAEWKTSSLASVIGSLEAGVSVNSVEDKDQDLSRDMLILKTSAVSNGRFLPWESKRIAPRDLGRARLHPLKDTIIISRMNTRDLVGECGYVDRDYPNLFVPDRLWMTRHKEDLRVSGRWLSYVLSSSSVKKLIGAAATGTSGSMKNLSKQAFLAIPILLPSLEEQTAIAAVLLDMDAEIAGLEQRRDKTRLLKQGMMQELLTGRIRLVPSEAVPA